MENEQADAGRAADPLSRDRILRRERGQGNDDHQQDWQPYPVDPYSVVSYGHTSYIHTYTHKYIHTYNTYVCVVVCVYTVQLGKMVILPE